jgi:hypothetical protein
VAIKIEQQPDFETTVEFISPGGKVSGTARMTWRAVPRSRFSEMMKLPVDEIIREALVRWHPDDIADEFSPENLTRLLDLIPSASRSMLDSWSVGLFGAERKN